jgi:hypothetical protein
MDTAKLESAGKSRLQDAGDRAQDYLDRASQTASSGMDRLADTARRGVDTATESAKAGLDWASDRADWVRTRMPPGERDDRYGCCATLVATGTPSRSVTCLPDHA